MARPSSWIPSILAGALLAAGCGGPGMLTNAPTAIAGQLAAAAAKGQRYTVDKATVKSRHWAKLERISSTYGEFPTEKARPNGRQTDPEIVQAFGTEMPASRDAVLHYAKGWDTGSGTPVLLVHGSILDATAEWVTPHGKDGLVKTLTDRGMRVFAVTYAHRHGDNFLWAEQLANAIARVKEVTGAKEVDVVAHSKGTLPVRAYASNFKLSWMQSYHHDIRRMVLIGGPHLGIDFAFRHPLVNLGLYPEKDQTLFNAPMVWDKMIAFGVWVNTAKHTLYKDEGNYFPGQSQMLYKWDKTYPLPKLEQDWYTTYYGGQGLISHSRGIDAAIEEGGHYIEKLQAKPLDPDVEVAVLAGDKANMANILNEKTGPADGVVFVKSATHTEDMLKGGAKLIGKQVMHLNHMDLVIENEPKNWVADLLQKK